MTVIDAHHHFWEHARRAHHWPAAAGKTLDHDFTPDDLAPELRAAGVDGTVLIQSLNDLEETQEYLDLAQQTPFVRGVIGWIPLDVPGGVEPALDALNNRDKLVGIRHLLRGYTTGDWLGDPRIVDSLAMLAKRGLVFELVPVEPSHFESLLAIADRLPELRIVINHLGRPPAPERGWEPWASLIARCAERPNMAIKLSAGMAMITTWKWSTAGLRHYTDHVLERFGARRVLAASNWPVILIAGRYQEVWRGITDLVSGLSADERAEVLGGTAQRVYRLK